MQLTTPLLQEISFQVCRGNAAFGLLLANEYLSREHPLRRALSAKAKLRLYDNSAIPETTAQSLLNGEIAASLNDDWRMLIGPKAVRQKERTLPAFKEKRNLTNKRRLAVRRIDCGRWRQATLTRRGALMHAATPCPSIKRRIQPAISLQFVARAAQGASRMFE